MRARYIRGMSNTRPTNTSSPLNPEPLTEDQVLRLEFASSAIRQEAVNRLNAIPELVQSLANIRREIEEHNNFVVKLSANIDLIERKFSDIKLAIKIFGIFIFMFMVMVLVTTIYK